MSENTQNFAMEHKPTRRERFWTRLGYRYFLVDLPDDAAQMPGWMMTTTRLEFSIADRLRLFLSGKIKIDIRQATDVPVEKCVSAASFSITPPFQRPKP